MQNSQVFILVQTRYAAYHRVISAHAHPNGTHGFVGWAGLIAHQCYIAPRGHGETMPTLSGNNFVIGGDLTLS